MYNYCTLFDSNYLSRGLTMYESLKKHSSSFHLYIFAFDEQSYCFLKKLNLEFVTVIGLDEFEDDELLAIKKSRTAQEYCWTCTPSVIKYSIEKYKLESCTYLDADLYFFDNPEILVKEMHEKSVLITEHRYTPKYDKTKTSGIYCVQFMTFKNDDDGMRVLSWWRDACIDWCYAKVENGKLGDQKYLDNWTERFSGIHVLQHLGGGLAPWNIQQYVVGNADTVRLCEKQTGETFSAVFYHFHGLKFLDNDTIFLGGYYIASEIRQCIYTPYIKNVLSFERQLQDNQFPLLCPGFTSHKSVFLNWRWYVKSLILGTSNIVSTHIFEKNGTYN